MRGLPNSSLLVLLAVGAAAACNRTDENGGPTPVVAPMLMAPAPTAPQVAAAAPVYITPQAEQAAAPPEPRVAIAAVPGIALNATSPAPAAPPPLRKPSVIPSLPALPSPAAYPKVAPPARGPDMEGCGHVWTGSQWAAISCVAPKLGSRRAAEVVIPYDRMLPPTAQLPQIVDHRAEGTEGPMRKQGGPLCTAFSFTSALDHAWARWTGQPGAFSVMQVWGRYYRKSEEQAAIANVGEVVSNEADWPYDHNIADTWRGCHGDEKPGVICGQSVDQAKIAELDRNAVAMITKVEVIPASQVDVLREKLAGGQDVVLQIKMPSLVTAGAPGATYLVGSARKNGTPGPNHAILLSGYAMTPNGTYYLVHNSFGPKWGDQGYAWLHEDFLKAYWSDHLLVIPSVEPLAIARQRSDAQGGLSRACDGDQVPDSISAICTTKCADGSPRHNNVCLNNMAECPRGTVNLTGECLLAAPTGSGSDARGIRWSCGPGGCAYWMPRGVLNCAQRECSVSCPAPDFRLATTPRGFVCVD